MKFHLIAAVLICALLSLSCANVIETEQNLSQLEEVPQNVDKQISTVEEPLDVALPEAQEVLLQIPELVQAVAKEQIVNDGIEEASSNAEVVNVPQEVDTKAIIVPQLVPVREEQQMVSMPKNREPKQLIGFIPTYVLREAIRMAQEQQSHDVRSLMYEDDDEDESNEIEEERAIRRRKRFRRRFAKDHLKKSRRHKNVNRHNLKNRTNFNAKGNSKRKVPKQRKSIKRKNLKKPQKNKRKANRRKKN